MQAAMSNCEVYIIDSFRVITWWFVCILLESERFEAFRSSRARVYITRGCSHVESSSIPPPMSLCYEPGLRAFTIKTHQLLPSLRHDCKFFSRLSSFSTPFVWIGSYWQEFSGSNFHFSNWSAPVTIDSIKILQGFHFQVSNLIAGFMLISF